MAGDMYRTYGYIEFVPTEVGFVTPVFINGAFLFIQCINDDDTVNKFEKLDEEHCDIVKKSTPAIHRSLSVGDAAIFALKHRDQIIFDIGSRIALFLLDGIDWNGLNIRLKANLNSFITKFEREVSFHSASITDNNTEEPDSILENLSKRWHGRDTGVIETVVSKDVERVWSKCLGLLKEYVNWRTYQTWFEPISAVSLKGKALTLEVPSPSFYEWLHEHYGKLLDRTIKLVLGSEGSLEYRILMEPNSGWTHDFTSQKLQQSLEGGNIIQDKKNLRSVSQLRAAYTFETYVEGDCNRVARSAGLHVAQKPGATAFNPFVVYGGAGWGKTHLVQAIGNEVRRLYPNKSVLYVSGEKFANQFIDHSKNNEINDFIHFYQLIDVLILDDIHLFVPATKTQDVFFAIFNHLHQSGKQIILTSDTPPKDLEGMQERLLSRFRRGLNADIQAPDFETRQHILHMKMKQEGLEIPEEVVKYVAHNVQTNVRELEGALIALLAQATLNRKEIDLDLAKRVMKNFVKTAARELTIENIQKMVCEYFHLPYDRLLAKTRKQEIVQARQVTMYLAKKFTKSSLKTIGDHFGGFDHTAVIHSCQTVENLMDTDTEYKEHLLELLQKVQIYRSK